MYEYNLKSQGNLCSETPYKLLAFSPWINVQENNLKFCNFFARGRNNHLYCIMKASSRGAKVDVLGNALKMELLILILDQRSRSFS